MGGAPDSQQVSGGSLGELSSSGHRSPWGVQVSGCDHVSLGLRTRVYLEMAEDPWVGASQAAPACNGLTNTNAF